jgi:hypothetical protein
VARTIHCTVVEVPAMSDPFVPREGGFRDLVPWADPYIASLVEKLRRTAAIEEALSTSDARSELPPPLEEGDPRETWEADWSPRNWPRK